MDKDNIDIASKCQVELNSKYSQFTKQGSTDSAVNKMKELIKLQEANKKKKGRD